ncbi:hypothetical protein SteCoe_1101 [Stentor coeruleus]|uniref:Uncharacterized protein n=1 Tax=Stentor coeruleus TaxID=5963 RepID=A0A1R2D2K6_9CILI|nr:hypothetical protein SteCoe_1101 [Stentor coeruleus]
MSEVYFSRAGRASVSKFKILSEKSQILSGKRPHLSDSRIKSEPVFLDKYIGKIVAQELENLKTKKTEVKVEMPSAVFKSQGRREIFTKSDVPDLGRYDVNFSLVEKTLITYSINKSKKNIDLQPLPDSFLSSNLHQFPDQNFKGIPFQCQTSRRDITEGIPSPNEERFKVQNLIPKSCSKFNFPACPDMSKYAKRHDFYTKKEYSPDYMPNKEFILPKLTKKIDFKNMTKRKSFEEAKDWPKIFDVNMAKQEKKNLIEEMIKKSQRKKNKHSIKSPRGFSPSKFDDNELEL